MDAVIKSPKATKVRAISCANGDRVEQGEPLFFLEAFEELKILSDIDISLADLSQKRSEILEGETKEIMRIHRRFVSLTDSSVKDAEVLLQAAWGEFRVGVEEYSPIISARQVLTLKRLKFIQANADRAVFIKRVYDVRKMFEHTKAILDADRTYIKSLIARLSITAPRSGFLHHELFAGYPVRRGHVLATITN